MKLRLQNKQVQVSKNFWKPIRLTISLKKTGILLAIVQE